MATRWRHGNEGMRAWIWPRERQLWVDGAWCVLPSSRGQFMLWPLGLATGRGGAGLDKNVPAPDQRTLPLALTLQWRAGRISLPPNVWSPVGSRYSRKIKLTWLRSVRQQRCQLQQCLLRAETATAWQRWGWRASVDEDVMGHRAEPLLTGSLEASRTANACGTLAKGAAPSTGT